MKNNDDFVDDLIEQAGGLGLFHFLFYLGVGGGINSVVAWLYY